MKLLLQSSNNFLTTTVKSILQDNKINYIDSEANLDGYLDIIGAGIIKNENIFVDESDFERAYSLVQEFLEEKSNMDNLYYEDEKEEDY